MRLTQGLRTSIAFVKQLSASQVILNSLPLSRAGDEENLIVDLSQKATKNLVSFHFTSFRGAWPGDVA